MTDHLIRCIFAIIRVIYNLCNSRSSVTLYLVNIALNSCSFIKFFFPYPPSRGQRGLCIRFDYICWDKLLLCQKRTLVLRYFRAHGTWGNLPLTEGNFKCHPINAAEWRLRRSQLYHLYVFVSVNTLLKQ